MLLVASFQRLQSLRNNVLRTFLLAAGAQLKLERVSSSRKLLKSEQGLPPRCKRMRKPLGRNEEAEREKKENKKSCILADKGVEMYRGNVYTPPPPKGEGGQDWQ